MADPRYAVSRSCKVSVAFRSYSVGGLVSKKSL